MKVDEQADGQSSQPEVGQKLSLMYWLKAVHGFDLDDERSLHQQIKAIAVLELNPLIGDGHWTLAFMVEAT